MTTVMPVCGGLRRLGSAALDLAYVACGRADAYWERSLKTWDMAAGLVIVREAGGFVTDPDGSGDPLVTQSVASGNEILHRELVALLRQASR
jgi:myo-inositol-1(or 4)-monophosphatase